MSRDLDRSSVDWAASHQAGEIVMQGEITQAEAVRQAITHLRAARDLLKAAGARRTLARVRLAITSAGGAERHAKLAPYREIRQAERARR